MSPMFLNWFRKKHDKCLQCRAAPVSNRSMCDVHLTRAREKWVNWSHARRSRGLCSYCTKKNWKGWLRCRAHTLYNRIKCKIWTKKNKKRLETQRLARKSAALTLGLCTKCFQPNPDRPEYTRCRHCRLYQWKWRQENPRPSRGVKIDHRREARMKRAAEREAERQAWMQRNLT